MKIYFVSLFPEMFDGVMNASMMHKAQEVGAVSFEFINIRDFGLGPRKQVDDTPYGGGDGMVLRPEPVVAAIECAKKKSPDALVILPTPRGATYKQSKAKQFAAGGQDLIIVCSRYEGYDERITDFVDEQISVGNYILTGGELPAMIIADSVVRLLPGVLGGETSAEKESFQNDDKSIEHPHFTRPEEFRGQKVPEVLLSGNHANIEKWRKES
ncbi:MAG: tRNA (guanosine(37)-N1)-methyltransferase TrmD [bacterium]|nr:tRNA (guanosine(37)-N1)-methyltransferase TrmD [bacterium]